jgi:hypothetical protein
MIYQLIRVPLLCVSGVMKYSISRSTKNLFCVKRVHIKWSNIDNRVPIKSWHNLSSLMIFFSTKNNKNIQKNLFNY